MFHKSVSWLHSGSCFCLPFYMYSVQRAFSRLWCAQLICLLNFFGPSKPGHEWVGVCSQFRSTQLDHLGLKSGVPPQLATIWKVWFISLGYTFSEKPIWSFMIFVWPTVVLLPTSPILVGSWPLALWTDLEPWLAGIVFSCCSGGITLS